MELCQVAWWFKVKNLPANAEDVGAIPWLGRVPREGNGNPLQYSCLQNPMDGGAWQSTGPKRIRHDLATKQQQWGYAVITRISFTQSFLV